MSFSKKVIIPFADILPFSYLKSFSSISIWSIKQILFLLNFTENMVKPLFDNLVIVFERLGKLKLI